MDRVLKVCVLFFNSYNLVDGGQRAVIFDRFSGVKDEVTGEGTHFLIPWVQKPIIFDIRSTPRAISTITGSKGIFHFDPLSHYVKLPGAI